MNKKLIPVIIILIFAAIVIITSLPSQNEKVDVDALMARAKAEKMPVFLQLSSVGCTTCQRMESTVDALEEKYKNKILIKKVDMDMNREAFQKFGVTHVPTQIFLNHEGVETFRHLGFYSEQNLEMVLNKMLQDKN